MAKKKLGIGQMEINKKFDSYEDACRYAKNLKQFIYDLCKRKADKGWMAQAMIVVSNTRSNATQLKYVDGKPRLIINDIIVDKIYHGDYKTDWHIHILIVSKPSVAFRNEIKKYVDKNWIQIPNKYNLEDADNEEVKKKVYKKYCNINMAKYFIEQSVERWFCNYNFTGTDEIKYGLDKYFREYMKLDEAKRNAYRKYMKHMSEDRLIKDLKKAESKFKEIEDYYYSITQVEDMKMVTEFIKVENNKREFNRYKNHKSVHDLQKILKTDIDEVDLFAGW